MVPTLSEIVTPEPIGAWGFIPWVLSPSLILLVNFKFAPLIAKHQPKRTTCYLRNSPSQPLIYFISLSFTQLFTTTYNYLNARFIELFTLPLLPRVSILPHKPPWEVGIYKKNSGSNKNKYKPRSILSTYIKQAT